MSMLRPTRIEWITFWVLMPVISVFVSFLLYGQRFLQDWRVSIPSFLAVYLIGLLSWYLHVVSMHFLAWLLPALKQTTIRLLLLGLCHCLLITITMWIYFYGFASVGFLGYQMDCRNFRTAVLGGLFLTVIATSLWQVEYIFNKWKTSLSEKELIEQQRLLHEYELLKKQINPHFLFNNLNILSSLIAEDPENAEYFLDELSQVYRYVLKNNEEELIDLQHELKFIHSYYALLNIRHGDAVQLTLSVNNHFLHYRLPALSLQLLVENAVKHNISTKKSPLHIEISTDENGWLTVCNNLQRKAGNIISNKIGLLNITENYRLLLNREPVIIDDGEHFKVMLPLLNWNRKTYQYERTDY